MSDFLTCSPLVEACREGDAHRVRVLLDSKAQSPLDLEPVHKNTPLHIAAQAVRQGVSGAADSIRLLIDAGAEVNRVNQLGRTPLFELFSDEKEKKSAEENQQDNKNEQEEEQEGEGSGEDVPARNQAQYSAQLEVARLIVQAGADLAHTAPDNQKTILHYCYRDPTLVSRLLVIFLGPTQ